MLTAVSIPTASTLLSFPFFMTIGLYVGTYLLRSGLEGLASLPFFHKNNFRLAALNSLGLWLAMSFSAFRVNDEGASLYKGAIFGLIISCQLKNFFNIHLGNLRDNFVIPGGLMLSGLYLYNPWMMLIGIAGSLNVFGTLAPVLNNLFCLPVILSFSALRIGLSLGQIGLYPVQYAVKRIVRKSNFLVQNLAQNLGLCQNVSSLNVYIKSLFNKNLAKPAHTKSSTQTKPAQPAHTKPTKPTKPTTQIKSAQPPSVITEQVKVSHKNPDGGATCLVYPPTVVGSKPEVKPSEITASEITTVEQKRVDNFGLVVSTETQVEIVSYQKNSIVEIQGQIEALVKKINELENVLEALTQERDQLRQACEENKGRLAEASSIIKGMDSALNELKDSKPKEPAVVRDEEQSRLLAEATARVEEEARDKEALLEKNKSLEVQLNITLAKLQEIKAQLEEAQETERRQSEMIARLDAENQNSRAEFHVSRSYIVQLSKQVQRLMFQLTVLSQENYALKSGGRASSVSPSTTATSVKEILSSADIRKSNSETAVEPENP